MPPGARQRIERRILLGPDALCRAAASRAKALEERWMLAQPRRVRASYVAEVLDQSGDPDLLSQIWMIRQAKEVRESYVRDVLEPSLTAG
jgi:hypothetical protein